MITIYNHNKLYRRLEQCQKDQRYNQGYNICKNDFRLLIFHFPLILYKPSDILSQTKTIISCATNYQVMLKQATHFFLFLFPGNNAESITTFPH